MKRIWSTPGTSSADEQERPEVAERGPSPAASDATASRPRPRAPTPATTSAPTSGSPPRWRPCRTATASAPKSSACERGEEDGGHVLRSSRWPGRGRSRRRSSPSTWPAARTRRSSSASTRSCSRTRPARWPASSSSGSALDRVAVPTVSYVDHNVLQFDDKNPEDHAYLRSWAARYGALYSRPGNGIAHYLHLERFARPGRRAGRRGQPHDDGRRARHARDRRRRDRGRGRDGRAAVRGRAAGGRRRRAARPRCRPWVQSKDVVLELLRAARRARRPRADLRVPRRRRRGADARPTAGRSATWSWRPARRPGSSRATSRRGAWLAAQGREDEFVELAADPGARLRRARGDRARRSSSR